MKTFFKVKVTFLNGETRELTGDSSGTRPPFSSFLGGIEEAHQNRQLAGWPNSGIRSVEMVSV